jgi:tetraacyldisaccharide 4'-kinase
MKGGWKSAYLRMTTHGPQSIGQSIIFGGLCALSFPYGLSMHLRSRLYRIGLKRSYRARVPVISVGNLATSGTGKTPMADFLAKRLKSRDLRCAIVSRGYGGHYRQAVGRVSDASGRLLMTPYECGDEPCLLARRNPGVPVYVARRRMLGVQAAEQDGARVIVLDDGFQHLAVQRDADIVLLDAGFPFGNGWLLPAGNLREPGSALQRADLIVLTRSGEGRRQTLQGPVPVIRSRHQLNRRLATLEGAFVPVQACAGKSCLAFAGIAKPDEFFRDLGTFGFSRIETLALADHQEYTGEILNRLLGSCHNHDVLVTTEKDAVKLSAVNFPKPCYQVGVELVFDDIAPLDDLLDHIMEPGK